MPTYADVQKNARILEGEIDLKLTILNKICSIPKPKFNYNATLPSSDAVEAEGSEIHDLLGKLNHLHLQMSHLTSDDASPLIKRSLTRHEEIFHDYKKELVKILDNYRAAKNVEELQIGRQPLSANRQRSDVEVELIRNSDFLVDQQLSVANETKLHLLNQRKSMKKIQSRLRDLYGRFPAVNRLLRKTGFAQHQNCFIMVVVILVILGLIFISRLVKNKI